MERLHFGPGSRYVALEAAHHLARYRFVKNLCRRKRVLDAACGEGYGAYLMAQWGAEFVDGVDISPTAIVNARKVFSNPKINFIEGNCEALDELIEPASYDLVVSFETLEHVDDVHAYLHGLKAAVRSNGNIVISCPNDHWMYREGGNNEFHRRRLSLSEFKKLTTDVLGEAKSWHRGTLAIGYSITSEAFNLPNGDFRSSQDLSLSFKKIEESIFVPTQIESSATDEELAFYIGVWGDLDAVDSLFSGYPVSMELTRRSLFPYSGIWAIKPDRSSPLDETQILQRKAMGLEVQLTQELTALHKANRKFLELTKQHEVAFSTLVEEQNTSREALVAERDAVVVERDAAQSRLQKLIQELETYRQKTETELLAIRQETEALRRENEKRQIQVNSANLRARAIFAENELLRNAVGHRDWLIERSRNEIRSLQEQLSAAEEEQLIAAEEEKQRMASLKENYDHLVAVVEDIPWRIVGGWRKLRPLVPRGALNFVGRVWRRR